MCKAARTTLLSYCQYNTADADADGDSMSFCTGLLWQACRQVYRVGVRAYLVDIYNATDFFMLKFYTASLVLRRLADLKVRLQRLRRLHT